MNRSPRCLAATALALLASFTIAPNGPSRLPPPELTVLGSASDSVFLDQAWIRARASAAEDRMPGAIGSGSTRRTYLLFEVRSSDALLPPTLEPA